MSFTAIPCRPRKGNSVSGCFFRDHGIAHITEKIQCRLQAWTGGWTHHHYSPPLCLHENLRGVWPPMFFLRYTPDERKTPFKGHRSAGNRSPSPGKSRSKGTLANSSGQYLLWTWPLQKEKSFWTVSQIVRYWGHWVDQATLRFPHRIPWRYSGGDGGKTQHL